MINLSKYFKIAVMQCVVKPRSQRAKHALEDRKQRLCATCTRSDLDLATMFRKHPELSLLFKDQAVSMKDLAGKEDAAPFAFGSHSKKRPDNLMLGHMIDGHLLDMCKLGVNNFKAPSDFKNERLAQS